MIEDCHGLDSSLAYEGQSRSLIREHGQFARRANAVRAHPLYFEGYDALLDRIEHHLGAARHPGEQSSDLTKAQSQRRVWVAERKQVARILSELEARIEERRRLLPEANAGGWAPKEHPEYRRWVRRCRRTIERSTTVRRERRYRPHVEATPQGDEAFRKRCAGLVSELRRAAEFDAHASKLLADWLEHRAGAKSAGRPPFYREGYASLMQRIEALDEAASDPNEVPRALRAARAEHAGLVADRDAVRAAADAARASVTQRDALLDQAVRDATQISLLPDHPPWRRRADAGMQSARTVLNDEERHGIHLDALAEGRAGLTENVDALVRAIDVDDRAYALCLDWAGGPHAYPADHERLVPGIEALVCEGVRPGELHPGLKKLLEDHRARTERAPARDGDHDHDRGTRRRRR